MSIGEKEKTDISISELLFVDFEASSLSQASWPIEVGVAWIEEGRARSWSSLIRPAVEWPAEDWSIASEAVHGIKRSELERAPAAEDVAAEFLQRCRGKILISDMPEFESRWAARLVETVGGPAEMRFQHFDTVAWHFFDGLALDTVYERLERTKTWHRAGSDAERMAKALLRGMEVATG